MNNLVRVFCGGRGSGKTLSMSIVGALALIKGYNVFANYPIRFAYRRRDGIRRVCESTPVEIEDLITFKPFIRDGFVLLDELNLWASNRGSSSLVNRLLNGWIQLMRKRNLAVGITVQAFETLDKFLRWQTDMTFVCYDMHYRYRNLPKGALISQRVTDWSGILTGRPVAEGDFQSRERNTWYRKLKAMRFHGIYATNKEFDILKAMRKVQVERPVTLISADGTAMPAEALKGVKEMADTIRQLYPNGARFEASTMAEQLKTWGVNTDADTLDKLLNRTGFKKKNMGGQDFYDFSH